MSFQQNDLNHHRISGWDLQDLPIRIKLNIYFRRIYFYSVASTNEAAFVIGGTTATDVIAQFKDDSWSLYGHLQDGRNWHGSITLDGITMVIGGTGGTNGL